MIAIKLKSHPDATILDPCAGEGLAVRRIATQSRMKLQNVYAMELDFERSKALRANLPDSNVTAPIDFLSVLGSGLASCVYCNPPFEGEIGGGGMRTEISFCDRSIQALQSDGVMVIVVPEHVGLGHAMQGWIREKLYDVTWMPFPDPDRKFDEIVIFGVKKKENFYSPLNMVDRERSFRDIPVYEVPAPLYEGGLQYRKREYTEQELHEFIDQTEASELLREKPVTEFLETRPPMPLRAAHLSMLLASGLINGLVEAGPDTHVVRGLAKKVKDERVYLEGKEVRTIETERISLSIKTVDLKGNIRQLSDMLKTETEIGDDDGVESYDDLEQGFGETGETSAA